MTELDSNHKFIEDMFAKTEEKYGDELDIFSELVGRIYEISASIKILDFVLVDNNISKDSKESIESFSKISSMIKLDVLPRINKSMKRADLRFIANDMLQKICSDINEEYLEK